jgi:hypothetical protein
MRKSDLSPCLWCEEKNAIVKHGVNFPFGPVNVMADGFYIACQTDDCGAATLHQPTEQDAIKAWNDGDVWGYDV